MKTQILLPNSYKKPGWILFIIGLVSGILFLINSDMFPQLETNTWVLYGDEFMGESAFFGKMKTTLIDEVISMTLLIGAFLTAFSQEKVEDEFIAKIRLDSLLWATYVNYFILAFTIVFIHGSPFWTVMILNMFTILIFFIVRFNWVIRRNAMSSSDEE